METSKTTFGARTKLPASMADLGSVVRLDPNNFNPSLDRFIFYKALQLVETPVANPIVHNLSSSLFPYSFEVFHHNLVSVKAGNNVFTYVMIYPLHPTSFSSREFFKQPPTGTSAFTLKFRTQILKFPFDLLDFSRIVKLAIGSDSKVIYSEVNAKNRSMRATVRLRGNDLFRECEDKETPTFLIHPKQTFRYFPSEVFFVAVGNIEVKLLPCLEKSKNKSVSFDVRTSWEVVSNGSSFNDGFCLGFLDHSTSLSHTSYSYLGREFILLSDSLIDSIVELEVLSNFILPSIINTELQSFSVSLDSPNYFFSRIDSDFSTYSYTHNIIVEEQVYKSYVYMSSGGEKGKFLTQLKQCVSFAQVL
ncbi:hypothetical protein LCGC14_1849940 [marine sediment metagenome]|uniref:Uncharacterized protein n=1 Tax=marine sediment metagenome TaxID=412755 RepID=A0A0F9IQ78_9ZZZZ